MIKRIAETKLVEYLNNCGAVLVTGPKYCGKTFLAGLVSKSSIVIKQGKYNEDTFELASKYVLGGPAPKLIDEWQNFPPIWDYVRHSVDEAPSGHKTGLYILTGSSTPILRSEVSHTGVGRILRMRLATLTFAEILNLNEENTISLEKLFNEKKIKVIPCDLTYEEINKMMFVGGWPYIIDEKINNPRLIINGYVDALSNMNDKLYYDLKVNPEVLNKILKSLARNIGTRLTRATIMKDLDNDISRPTLDKYIQMIYESDLIFNLEAWSPINMRSRYKLISKPKIYLCDTSLFCSILGIRSETELLEDLHSTGFIFENQVIKDLTVYCDAIDAKLYYLNDERGNEIDAIIQLRDGRWAAVEIKLSVEAAFKAANELDKKLDNYLLDKNLPAPEFKLIICNCQTTYDLENGTFIVPHALLRP